MSIEIQEFEVCKHCGKIYFEFEFYCDCHRGKKNKALDNLVHDLNNNGVLSFKKFFVESDRCFDFFDDKLINGSTAYSITTNQGVCFNIAEEDLRVVCSSVTSFNFDPFL